MEVRMLVKSHIIREYEFEKEFQKTIEQGFVDSFEGVPVRDGPSSKRSNVIGEVKDCKYISNEGVYIKSEVDDDEYSSHVNLCPTILANDVHHDEVMSVYLTTSSMDCVGPTERMNVLLGNDNFWEL